MTRHNVVRHRGHDVHVTRPRRLAAAHARALLRACRARRRGKARLRHHQGRRLAHLRQCPARAAARSTASSNACSTMGWWWSCGGGELEDDERRRYYSLTHSAVKWRSQRRRASSAQRPSLVPHGGFGTRARGGRDDLARSSTRGRSRLETVPAARPPDAVRVPVRLRRRDDRCVSPGAA